MAGLESILQILPVVQQGVGFFTSAARAENDFRDERQSQKLALRQLQERQAEQQKQIEEDAALDRERIAVQAEKEDRKRRDALRRAVARQRANFGASGVSSTGGSAEAVLLGLFEETDSEREERERLDNLRFGAIDQNIDQRRRLNVIQRTQLQESQRIGRLSSQLDRGTSLFNTGVRALGSIF